MQDISGQESDNRLPIFKTASVSDSQPKYIKTPISGNFSRIHRQIISLDKPDARERNKFGMLDQPWIYNNQIESRAESSCEITAVYEPVENGLENYDTVESNRPPLLDELLALQVKLALHSDFKAAAESEPDENELSNNIIWDLDQPLVPDKLPALEVELEMNSDYESTVLFEPCGNQPELEVEMEMVEDIQNRIQALEERVIQLESKITRLIDMDQSHKKRSIIPLNGSMAAPACGCGVCSVEPQE